MYTGKSRSDLLVVLKQKQKGISVSAFSFPYNLLGCCVASVDVVSVAMFHHYQW